MYDGNVFTCWRGLEVLVPVPGAAADRVNGMTPRLLVNCSRLSRVLNGMFAAVAPLPESWRRPKVWSRNWPHAQPHWVTRRPVKMLKWLSWMIRLDELRGLLPVIWVLMPSA